MSHLMIAADAPWYAHAAADAVLALHIGGGTTGLLAGATALVAKKGGRVHQVAGNVFFGAMMVMAAIGASISPVMQDRVSTVAGVMTLYLLVSAWLTVRRRPGQVGRFEIAAAVIPVGVLVLGLVFMAMAARSPTGTVDGDPPQAFYVFAVVGAVAAASDLKLILRRGLFGVERIARHLWRMCTALFIASGSLFLGQPQLFPVAIRHSGILFIPALAPLVLLVFWMVRVRLTGWGKVVKAARALPADRTLLMGRSS